MASQHSMLQLQTPSQVDHQQKASNATIQLKLRLDWTNLPLTTELSRQMAAHQGDCSLPLGTLVFRNRFGLGSDLHQWGQALCNGLEKGLRLRTVEKWIWMDQTECGESGDDDGDPILPSAMLCYFPHAELVCKNDTNAARQHPHFDPTHSLSGANGYVEDLCPSIQNGTNSKLRIPVIRRAATEFLMSKLHPRVIQDAERQLNIVFRGHDEVPKDLITVHVRWGDKGAEMKLVQIEGYIRAVQSILEQRQNKTTLLEDNPSPVNIFLATEDPEAVSQFQRTMPGHWNVFVDQAHTELVQQRIDGYNGSPKLSKALKGRVGLLTLGSLLVAMEADAFVLTTESNWSRVMNEIRQTILDSRCGNCTTMIDLRPVRNEF